MEKVAGAAAFVAGLPIGIFVIFVSVALPAETNGCDSGSWCPTPTERGAAAFGLGTVGLAATVLLLLGGIRLMRRREAGGRAWIAAAAGVVLAFVWLCALLTYEGQLGFTFD